jgi:hypothetical protein
MRARTSLIQCVSSFLQLYTAYAVRELHQAITSMYSLYNA